MTVAYVLKRYPRLSETFVVNEILGLEASGVDVAIKAIGYPAESRFHRTITEVRAPVSYLPEAGRSSTVAATFDTLRDPAWTRALPRALDFLDRLSERQRVPTLIHGLHLAASAAAEGIDHFHAHFMTTAAHTAYVAHLFCGVPFSVTAHAKDIFSAGVDRGVFREVAQAARAVITVSDYNVEYIERQLLKGTPARVEMVYNGFDTSARQTAGAQRDRELILAVGRLVEKKGFEQLIRAVPQLPASVNVVIVGEGEQRPRLERVRAELELQDRVQLVGAQSGDEVADWMARARVLAAPFVVGSDGNQDALPTVLVEALCAGLPVVAANIAGVPEIIEHGVHGLIVRSGDQAAFTTGLLRILSDDPLHKTMSGAGPGRAAALFDRKVTIPRFLEAIGLSDGLAVAS